MVFKRYADFSKNNRHNDCITLRFLSFIIYVCTILLFTQLMCWNISCAHAVKTSGMTTCIGDC